MSTILKALKRIDQTTPPPEDLQSWPPTIDTKETVRSRVYKIWLHRKVFLAIIVVLVMGTAGWLIYSQKHRLISKFSPEKTSPKGPIYQAKIDTNQSVSEGSAKAARPSYNRQQNSRSAAKPEQNQLRNDTSSQPLPRLQGRQKTPKNPIYSSSKETQPLKKRANIQPGISQSQKAGLKNTIQRSARPKPAAPAGKSKSRTATVSASYRRLDDSKLKLQAIAWSNDAVQRIAVINGHIVREGESVEGYSVNQIRQEDVIVSDGTESWRLEFGLK